jgi:Mn-dependent DtxR family transcriptional regulator
MRSSGDWQSVWDDRILEVAAEDEDGAVSVGDLDKHGRIRISQSSISRRCQKLAEHDLLRKIGDGVYIITEEGRAYLNEEYDAGEGVYLNDDVSENGPTATGTNGV